MAHPVTSAQKARHRVLFSSTPPIVPAKLRDRAQLRIYLRARPISHHYNGRRKQNGADFASVTLGGCSARIGLVDRQAEERVVERIGKLHVVVRDVPR